MESFISDLSLLLGVVAIFSYIAVILKQPIIIAYILSGVLIGPWGLKWIQHVEFIDNISHLGITLLLFLAGLNLHPQKLIRLFKKTALATMGNCFFSFLIAFCFALLFRFGIMDSFCIGLALMFSSTILAVKLLPTTALHHKRIGSVCIGVLIMQDLLAIAVLAFIRCLDASQGIAISFILLTIKLCVFLGALILFEQFVLRKIMKRVERLHELLFILGLAWCFGIANISNNMGLFYETGAFFAGVVLARHPISLFISEKLKPLRDFFLVLFFFTLGAKLDLFIMKKIFLPAAILAAVFILVKPWLFKKFFILAGEEDSFSKEAGIRLGQLSEFFLLVAIMALELGHISMEAA
ncbi:Inner membrane protein, KefB/KefC family [hydrothermal vent metagenome]|uniref:Inner membrane protein, KefB/KefC family n=1 Tax=hydrothermal vent metagenome TaxID=652676 RepID=A0A3B1DSX1_9ZZZZ